MSRLRSSWTASAHGGEGGEGGGGTKARHGALTGRSKCLAPTRSARHKCKASQRGRAPPPLPPWLPCLAAHTPTRPHALARQPVSPTGLARALVLPSSWPHSGGLVADRPGRPKTRRSRPPSAPPMSERMQPDTLGPSPTEQT